MTYKYPFLTLICCVFLSACWLATAQAQQTQGLSSAQEQIVGYISKMPPESRAHYDQALLFYQDKKFQPALKEIRLAGEAVSNNPLPFYIMGTIYNGMGDLNNAAKSYAFAVAVDDTFSMAHLDLGLTLKKLGYLPRAKEHVGQHLILSPDTPFMNEAQSVLDAQE